MADEQQKPTESEFMSSVIREGASHGHIVAPTSTLFEPMPQVSDDPDNVAAREIDWLHMTPQQKGLALLHRTTGKTPTDALKERKNG